MCKNVLSYEIYEYLLDYYANEQAPKQSFFSQLDKVSTFARTDISELLSESMITSIDAKFTCNDIELRECISAVLNNYNIFYSHFYINLLNNFLYVEFWHIYFYNLYHTCVVVTNFLLYFLIVFRSSFKG